MDVGGGQDSHITVFAEKSWLIGMSVAFLVQVFGGIWWAAVTSTKLSEIERALAIVQAQLVTDSVDRTAMAHTWTKLEDRIARLEELIRSKGSADYSGR